MMFTGFQGGLMARIIPDLNKATLGKMTSGERRFAQRLDKFLEDDYLVWYDIPVGSQRRYPDFIILHPGRGLLFLEVKDWKLETIKELNKKDVTILTPDGLQTCVHPLEQARQSTYTVLDKLKKDKKLQQPDGKYAGKLIMPYSYGVVFTNITRQQMQKSLPEHEREELIPDHLAIYRDEMTEKADPEEFQELLWGMFSYNFNQLLTLPEIDRVRWHLFPECRIEHYANDEDEDTTLEEVVPDIIRIMDIQQEQLARSLGEGHRVIHGVAGSGKTMILGYRCIHLAATLNKPILVLCYNVTLAAKLRSMLKDKVESLQVNIMSFHAWCQEQCKTYHVDVLKGKENYSDRLVKTIIEGVDKERIPREQYGALLIDEGHDFEESWLQLVVQMIDKESNSLLMLYDDAQSIYKSKAGLGFSLSSVGIQARGRTTILKLNYRNTREILEYAYEFSHDYMAPTSSKDEEHVPLIKPEGAGARGLYPRFKKCDSLADEIDFTVKCIKKWVQKDIQWNKMAVLCFSKSHMTKMKSALDFHQIPNDCLLEQNDKKNYDATLNQVTIVTVHSSKGLEFPRVIIIGLGQIKEADEEEKQHNARLLYVGMTRAQDRLVLTTNYMNNISKQVRSTSEKLSDLKH